jgi:hypothetical protein
MSLLSFLRRLAGGREEATSDLALMAGAPESYLAFGGPAPKMPAQPIVDDHANSLFVDRRVDEILNLPPAPRPRRAPERPSVQPNANE